MSWSAMVKDFTWNVSESPRNGFFGIAKVHFIDIILYPFFYRVWGSEETLNEYKAKIRIFSVRHQDTPGVQERFYQKKSKNKPQNWKKLYWRRIKRWIESGRTTFCKSLNLWWFVQVLEWSSYPTQCEQVVMHLLAFELANQTLINYGVWNDFILNNYPVSFCNDMLLSLCLINYLFLGKKLWGRVLGLWSMINRFGVQNIIMNFLV